MHTADGCVDATAAASTTSASATSKHHAPPPPGKPRQDDESCASISITPVSSKRYKSQNPPVDAVFRSPKTTDRIAAPEHAITAKNDRKRSSSSAIRSRRGLARRAVIVVILALSTFYGHKYMQGLYYTHCRSNVFVAVLFNRSLMCMQLNTVLTAIEHVWGHVFEGLFRSVSFWSPQHLHVAAPASSPSPLHAVKGGPSFVPSYLRGIFQHVASFQSA